MKPTKKNRTLQLLKASAGGMAAATRGRARRFQNKKKEAARRACRK
tara:strand:+ start:13463 stop:13600 length:138 start_codon:yes stop_codon:yes gene_type:complete